MVWRSAETKPAADKPTLVIGDGDCAINSLTKSATRSVRATPPSFGVSLRIRARIFPSSSTIPPSNLVPPTSIPIASVINPRCVLSIPLILDQ